MKTLKNSTGSRQRWLRKPVLSSACRSWLVDEGSLTARLKARYPDFVVQPVMLEYAKALHDETGMLGLNPHEYALIREVLLMGGGQPVVFAHSVLPRVSLRGPWGELGKLGNKPLGAALFANPRVRRTPLEYLKLSPHHALYRHAIRHSPRKPGHLWARRSVFTLKCAKILVTEIFLPALFK